MSTTQMNKPGRRGLPRIIDAGRYSMRGLRAAWTHEEGFRTECVLMLILAPLAVWLASTPVEFLLLVGSCALVMLAEVINSAIEAIVDRVSLDQHPLSGQAKDLGSAAVFICMMLVLLVWGTIAVTRFWPSQ
mgnify:CR=1 FL=1